VLGFPCNQFGKQEPGSNEEILEFVQSKYDVTFPMFSKINVKGDDAAPLYERLKAAAPHEDGSTEIKWNFEKFLVDKDGKVVKRFATKVTPEQLASDVAAAL
jgi:glutathione peroxidase